MLFLNCFVFVFVFVCFCFFVVTRYSSLFSLCAYIMLQSAMGRVNMFMDERRSNVLNFLDKHNSATVKHLAQYFRVTKETIRSDLRMLAQQGYIQRCHGGAIIIRKILQSKLISETDNDFEVLLKNIRQQKYEKGSVDDMRNKVCILGSFNVDIVAKVARFPGNASD